MVWFGDTPKHSAFALGIAVLMTSLNAAALALRPFTIVRTRGLIGVGSDQFANSERQWVNYGHIVVQDTATAIGITAIPTLITDDDSDWFVFEQVGALIGVSSATSVFSYGTERVIDSKAMRKVDMGQDLVSVVESAATGVSEGVSFREYTRSLIKLH